MAVRGPHWWRVAPVAGTARVGGAWRHRRGAARAGLRGVLLLAVATALAAGSVWGGAPVTLPARGVVTVTDSSGSTTNTGRIVTSQGAIIFVTVYVRQPAGTYRRHAYKLRQPLPLAGLDGERFFRQVLRPLMRAPANFPFAAGELLGAVAYTSEDIDMYYVGGRISYDAGSAGVAASAWSPAP